MSIHPNAILMATLIPDGTSRKTMREIMSTDIKVEAKYDLETNTLRFEFDPIELVCDDPGACKRAMQEFLDCTTCRPVPLIGCGRCGLDIDPKWLRMLEEAMQIILRKHGVKPLQKGLFGP